MNKTTITRRLLVLASSGLAMLLIAAPIRAHEPKRHSHGHKHHQKRWNHGHRGHHDARIYSPRHGDYRPYYAPRPLVLVPRNIAVHDAPRYRPYRQGTVWYAAHRHSHTVYRFPVRGEYGVVQRPHYYCNGELFVDSRIGYRGNRVSFNIRF